MELPQLAQPLDNNTSLEAFDYPNRGVGGFEGCYSSSQVGSFSLPRVNSFSACKTANNIGLVAVSSQSPDLGTLPATTDDAELSRRRASRVYVFATSIGDQYASPVRLARVKAVDGLFGENCDGGVDVRVDEDIFNDTNMNFVWSLDGDFPNRKFHIGARIGTNVWRLKVADGGDPITAAEIGACFQFVSYCPISFTSPASLTAISPLPYIEVNGLALPAINPQIASNALGTTVEAPYVYIVAEAPVNGVYQLFFYSFQLTSDAAAYSVFGWKQLTFDGSNRNAKLSVDATGNLHVAWETSRCQPDQIAYGVLGPSSRAIINEVFISALDKQSQSNKRVNEVATNDTTDSEDIVSRFSEQLVDISEPNALDLRDRDEYGSPIGEFWTAYANNGGAVTVTDDGTISVSGNPSTDKFAAIATLRRDEYDVEFDGLFSQLSYQLSFNLKPSSSSISVLTDDEIEDMYTVFKQGFTPSSGSGNVNTYTKDGILYTIGYSRRIYDNIIPFAGSFKAKGYSDTLTEQIGLRHFMLVAMPEKVRFIATSASGSIDKEEYYTGYYKLALVFETSANIEHNELAQQRHHWVRMFGDPYAFGDKHNIKLAVHYAKLREENTSQRKSQETIESDEQNVRFTGNIIVAVDNAVQAAENFVPDFSDQYEQFDIGIGCLIVSEYRSPNITPHDGSINENVHITFDFDRITVSPHSLVPDPFLTNFGKSDRNVSKMVVKTDVNELESLTAAEENLQTSAQYLLTLGLDKTKVKLGQVPITFDGRNSNPSLCVDSCGHPHIAYQSNRYNSWDIFYTGVLDASLPFRFDTRITRSDSNSIMPSVAVDNQGRRLVAWQDDREGKYQIFAARSTKTFSCTEGICVRDQLADDLGFDPSDNYVRSEYEYGVNDPYYASICQLRFKFTNQTSTAASYHFRASFYYDATFASFAKYIDSRYDISNWVVKTDDGEFAINYGGFVVDAGQTIEVIYNISDEDGLQDQVYYVKFETDDGYSIDELDRTVAFFCPVKQLPKCDIPCLYTNWESSTKSAHFRVTVYRDERMTEAVMSVDSHIDQAKWLAGGSSPFPSSGITVAPGETVNVVYNPDFVEVGSSLDQITSTSLLCNTKYWVIVESLVDGSYTEIDSFALLCSCDAVDANVWRTDRTSRDWVCSGQGSMDLRVTSTSDHAMFPSAAGSPDGMIYLAWEDHRFANGQIMSNTTYTYWAAWDAVNDVFYCSAQGHRDREAGTTASYRPIAIVSNMLYPSVFWQTDTGIYTKTCSLYSQANSTATLPDTTVTQIYDDAELVLSADDLTNCLWVKIYEPDIVRLYHKDHDTPIALVDNCQVRLEVQGPLGTYAIRLKNENDDWTPWLSISPHFYTISSSSNGAIQSSIEGTFVSDDRFIIPWVMSPGSGNKTVNCQILTYKGRTPTVSTQVIARYTELTHSIDFFRDAAMTIPASVYNGYPVISTKAITVAAADLTTIEKPAADNGTIYVRVVFDDPDRLQNTLDLTAIDRFASHGNVLTFDVISQGKSQYALPLTEVPSGDNVLRGTYKGSFAISKQDGFDNVDGLAVVVVNVPSPCEIQQSSSSVCGKPARTTASITLDRHAAVDALPVDAERFRQMYTDAALCSFLSPNCVDGVDPDTDTLGDDTVNSQPPYTGPATCDAISWSSPRKGEKYFYVSGGVNADDWTVYSPQFELDFSDPRTDYLKFLNVGTDTRLDDILVMVKPNDVIGYAESNTASSSSSSACSFGGSANPKSVIFSLPDNAVIFAATDGYYCHQPGECNNGSAQKTFKVSNNTITIGTVPAGTSLNNGTGDISLFSMLPNALGKQDGALSSSSSSSASNVDGAITANFTLGISKNELQRRGFISANGTLRFKLVHIISGIGFANISMTCGASCDE